MKKVAITGWRQVKLTVIEQSPLVRDMISYIIPMSDVQRALEISASQKSAKIILKPWE